MKLIKNLIFFLMIFIFFSGCTTIRFGNEKKQYSSQQEKDDIRELDLSFSYKVMGVNVFGPKSISENIFVHPDGKTIFVFISYPKIGILKSTDNGKTFLSQFFRLKFLDRIYGYAVYDENENKNGKTKKEDNQLRYFSHFASSKKNPADIIITLGPYVFYSSDFGQKWKVKNIFIDYEKSNIKDIFVNDKDEVIIFTENKIAISQNWGEKWEVRSLKIPGMNFFKTNYITGFYDNSTDRIYSSIQSLDESDPLLSKNTYEFFYQNKNASTKSGVYFSDDKGKSWNSSGINVPLAMWKYNGLIYGCPIYPLSFYIRKFDENFTGSPLHTAGKLDKSSYNSNDYLEILLNSDTEDFEILSKKQNRLVIINGDKREFTDENNFENIYNGIKHLENIDYLQWQDGWYSLAKSGNFNYEYNPYRMFKLWTGMRTNMPVTYANNNGIYYRTRPTKEFKEIFFKYAVDNQMRLNGIHPFLKKNSDVEFFDPSLDPSGGFPAVVEYSRDNGKIWTELISGDHVRNMIDPVGNKRSAYYWFKNVEQKKNFKLELSFGFDQGINYLTYPVDLNIYNNCLLMQMNYFSILSSYKDAYVIPLYVK
jgi:hypothetical protein